MVSSVILFLDYNTIRSYFSLRLEIYLKEKVKLLLAQNPYTHTSDLTSNMKKKNEEEKEKERASDSLLCAGVAEPYEKRERLLRPLCSLKEGRSHRSFTFPLALEYH